MQISFKARSVVGVSESPFSLEQEIQPSMADAWAFDAALPPLVRADGEEWVGWLLSLAGAGGTFLLGDLASPAPRGTWVGQSPLVNGAAQTGKSLNIKGLTAGATGKAGDWLQLGSGATTHLHKLTQGFTANGSGQAALDIFPRLRVSPADSAAIILANAKGIWRLASNDTNWSIDVAISYGLKFSGVEAI
jgi:hypothetical protein